MCAEKRKTKTQLRWEFNDHVFETIMKGIVSGCAGTKETIEIRTNYKMSYRKIHLKAFGQDVTFEILGSGIVKIALKAPGHRVYEEELFVYTEETDRQDEFIKKLEQLMRNIMSVFLGKDGEDFHSYMRYVDYRGLSVFEAYEMLADEGRIY